MKVSDLFVKALENEGAIKLMKSLNQEFIKANLSVRRDTLFKVLRKYKM
jgi:hypothetical protein